MKRLLKLSALFLALILLTSTFCSCAKLIRNVVNKGISEAKEKINNIGQNIDFNKPESAVPSDASSKGSYASTGTSEHEHDYVLRYDDSGHWKECTVCGDKTEHEWHSLNQKYDENSHYNVCAVCGYQSARQSHALSFTSTGSQHWAKCQNCGYTSSKQSHAFSMNGDEDRHWNECTECGYATGYEKHTYAKTYRDGAYRFVCSKCGYVSSKLPEPTFGTQAWVKWLVDDDGETYNMLLTGTPYMINWESLGGRYDGGSYESSPWEIWPWDWSTNSPMYDYYAFQMCWMFDRDEINLTANVGTYDYEFVWEIWYRDAEDVNGDYKVITTAPWSVYDMWGDTAIYRLPTWDDGMKDLKLNSDGSAREYEFVFVIYKNGRKSADNLIGWQQTWIEYTDSTQLLVEYGLQHGVISR